MVVAGRLTADRMGQRLQAAEDGLGIARVVERWARRPLRSGALVRMLAETVGKRERLILLDVERSHLDPKVRTFMDHLSREIVRVRGDRDGGPGAG
jgi:DNA-binding transcriptional LysR family regulator